MRRRIAIALGGAVAALGVSALAVPGADAGLAAPPQAGSAHPAGVSSICQSNLNPADDTLQSVSAQRFPGSAAPLSSMGATLVLIPAGGSCTVNYLIANGQLSGPGPVLKVNLWVRKNATSGMARPVGPNLAPGNLNIAPSSISTPPGYYNITTTLAAPITISAPPTAAKRFWVIFQVRMNPSIGGKWTWEVVTPDPAFDSDVWRNQPGGWGCGTAWIPVSTACLGGAPGKGLMSEVGT